MAITGYGARRTGGDGATGFGAAVPGSGGGTNTEALERTGRRLNLLATYAPQLAQTSPEGVLAMAEEASSDDSLLRQATEATNFAAIEDLRARLENEDNEVQDATFRSLPETISDALRESGYNPPEIDRDEGRLFGSIPVLGDVTEAALDWGEVPGIGGILEEFQHGTGEALEQARDVTDTALTPFTWLAEKPLHLYRAWKNIEQETPGGAQIWDYFSPGRLSRAWSQTGEGDGYVLPGQRSKAREILGGDRQLYDIAHMTAMGKTPDEIIEEAGYEPDSPEAQDLGLTILEAMGQPEFQDAVHELSVGQVSFGRNLAQGMGLDDTDNGWGRVVSGTVDAGFDIASDPTLGIGRATKGLRFGRHAFRLESAGDVEQMYRTADIATDAIRATEKLSPLRRVRDPKPMEVRRARGHQRWAERVAEGFRTGDLASLGRELPNTNTALDTMHRAHLRRSKAGERALDTPLGVMEWLREDRGGLLALTSTRLGGASPMTQGIRLPVLTNADRAAIEAKGYMTQGLDWARGLEAPQLKEIVKAAGRPQLARELGRYALAHTVGDAGRVLTALSQHVPYGHVQRLFGDESVEEFQRLVNTGIFGNMSRSQMDEYVNAFATGNHVTRSNMTEQFLEQLFQRTGVSRTPEGQRWAEQFVGRHRQAYALGEGDEIINAGRQTRAARLVDGQHADALAIPDLKEFLHHTRQESLTRTIFHNQPVSFINAKLGRLWKPAVLMRLGFIPRAAGEELLHFQLKHGVGTWLGAKGAEWQDAGEVRSTLESSLAEAQALGRSDDINRIEQQLARVRGGPITGPMRSLAAFMDRSLTHLLSTDAVEHKSWRDGWITKEQRAMDERPTVSGLESFANHMVLHTSGVVERVARMGHMPTKTEIGRIMAERWDPSAVAAARLMNTNPRIARAWAESISGQSMTPWEWQGLADDAGMPLPKVRFTDRGWGLPVTREVDLRPEPGSWTSQQLAGTGQDSMSYFASMYGRHRRLAGDRVSERVMTNVLPRWVGPWGDGVASRVGTGDVQTLRRSLNDLWAHAPDTDEAVSGPRMLAAARRLLDEPDAGRGLEVWLAKAVDDSGVGIDGQRLVATLVDPKVENPAQRWLAYESVDPDRLIGDWATLERQITHAARGRLARPDMYPKLREMRLYSDERLALPAPDGISKVYVPLVPSDITVLGDDFVETASRRIRMIGGYSQERAETIARNVQANVERGREAAADMGGLRPLSGWGANDPRVADAVMATIDEMEGVRSTFGILEVPDDAIRAAGTDQAMGLTTSALWDQADDYTVDPWRMVHVTPTSQQRRMSQLDIGDEWWDDAALDAATAAYARTPPDSVRLYSADRGNWAHEVPEGPFWFVDAPTGTAPGALADDLVDEWGARRLPSVPPEDGRWPVVGREVGDGLGEIEALERVAHASTEELTDVLTTLNRQDLDNDVLHEIVEPMLRPNRVVANDIGQETIEHGYSWEHLVGGTQWERLPLETYGPEMVGERDLRWDKMVGDWFDGPVDQALSSVIRKPMFLRNFGEQLRNTRAVADVFVEPEIAAAARASGLEDEALDSLALALREGDSDDEILDAYRTVSGNAGASLSDNEITALRRFGQQRTHGLEVARDNALNRAIQLTTPYIDDHRVRSAFQQYVGNFVPFQFAEEQFLKRWTRSIAESPEIIRRGQLAMNGLRSMGTVRTDEQGHPVFVYPLIGDMTRLMAKPMEWIFGHRFRVPLPGQMLGRVDYTLPGLGDQMGVPSVGPLVAMSLELLSRRFPELAEIEQGVSRAGADRPVWQYFVPSWAGRVWEASTADMTNADLASATNQAIAMAALNGQMPAEGASPDQQQEFMERVESQARMILLARGLFGMVAPAAPRWETTADMLNTEYAELLRTSGNPEEATRLFLERYPDAEPADILSATVFQTESEFAGLPTPTDETFAWIDENSDIVGGFQAGAPWLLPRPSGADNDRFSYRAWAQQLARGLRRRKTPEEFRNDIYFQMAAREYFDERTNNEARRLTSTGADRQRVNDEWNAFKSGYYTMHPIFADMLQDPKRAQRRSQAMEELTTLIDGRPDLVPDDLAEMVERFREYQMVVSGMRGRRGQGITEQRRGLTQEFVSWGEWFTHQHPNLSGFWMQIVEPQLRYQDEDAVARGAA